MSGGAWKNTRLEKAYDTNLKCVAPGDKVWHITTRRRPTVEKAKVKQISNILAISLNRYKSHSHSVIWTERIDDGCRRVNRDLHQSSTVMSRRHRSGSVDDNNHVFCLRRSNLHIEWPTIKITLITTLTSVIWVYWTGLMILEEYHSPGH